MSVAAERPVKEALFEAALDVIIEDGAAALSLREVARRAGVSHAAPYNHFANKNALLLALSSEGYQRLDRSMADAQAIAGAAPDAQLCAIGLGYVMFAVRNPELYELMGNRYVCPRDDADTPLPLEDSAQGRLGEAVIALRKAQGHSLEGDAVALDCLTLWSLVHGLAHLMNNGLVPEIDSGNLSAVRALLERSLALYPGLAGASRGV